MFKGIKAVIFDIDGTLLDSMGIWTDIDDIFVLKELNLITAIEVSDKSGRMLICPDLTDRGKAYIASNPTLKNPTIWDDKKYIINTIISVAALIVAIIALFK